MQNKATSVDSTISSSIRSYLISKPSEAEAHLKAPIRALVKAEGGIFSDGTFLVYDKETTRHVALTWPKKESELSDLVPQTTEPPECGGQGSRALVDLLKRVAKRLHVAAHREFEAITKASTLNKITFRIGDEIEEVGERRCSFVDDDGAHGFTPHTLGSNLDHLNPSCASQQWFQAIALRPGLGDSVAFDELNSMVRSGNHVVDFSSGKLEIRPLRETDRMLLDAGHDLSADLDGSTGSGFTTLADTRVATARQMMAHWMGEHTDFFLASVAERLFCSVRKEAHVFETPSDRGKTALLDVLLMGFGTYARRLPNDAVSGANKRMAPLHEATLSRSGVRFLLHDEVDTVDWNYLKSQSNGASGEEWGVGMTATLTTAHKATRILTRNATTTMSVTAPADCRRKIVLWTGDTLHAPPPNQALYECIKAKDPVLARSFFLLVVDTFRRLDRKRPVMPHALIAGTDLVPVASTDAESARQANEIEQALHTLTIGMRLNFHRLYRRSTVEEGGTKADEVKATLCALDGMPTLLSKLSLDSFTQDVLRAGSAVPGDADPIPPVLSKGNVGVAGDGKRSRVSSVMLCLPR